MKKWIILLFMIFCLSTYVQAEDYVQSHKGGVGTGVTDGDKGDVTVSDSGSVYTVDAAPLSGISGLGAGNATALAIAPDTTGGMALSDTVNANLLKRWPSMATADGECLSSAPASPVTGRPVCALVSSWDPLTLGGSDNYLVVWDGASWVGFIKEDGTLLVGSIGITGNIVTTGELNGLTKIVTLTHASGVHDGGNNQTILTDSGESFVTNSRVGMTLYNITDGSSGIVTANNGTTITATLAGGIDNDWDDGDAWQVGPGPNQSGSMFIVSASSTIRHPATAGYGAFYMALGTATLTIDMASDSMIFTGVLNTAVVTLDAGDSIDTSGSTTDDYIGIINISTTACKGTGKRGTLVDGGAT